MAVHGLKLLIQQNMRTENDKRNVCSILTVYQIFERSKINIS